MSTTVVFTPLKPVTHASVTEALPSQSHIPLPALATCHKRIETRHIPAAVRNRINRVSTLISFRRLTAQKAQNLIPNILPRLSWTPRCDPWSLAYWGGGVTSLWLRLLVLPAVVLIFAARSRPSRPSCTYLLHHCHPPALWWAIAVLNPDNRTWIQIR